MVPVAESLLEVDEDLLLSLGSHARDLPPACSLDPGEPPILDVRFHKALTNLLEIQTHYGAPFWAHVDQDIDMANLEDWDEVNDLPSVVWLSGDTPGRDYWRRISSKSRITAPVSHV